MFDLDDTLIHTQYTYNLSAINAMTVLQNELIPYTIDLLEIEQMRRAFRVAALRSDRGPYLGSFEDSFRNIVEHVANRFNISTASKVELLDKVINAASLYRRLPSYLVKGVFDVISLVKQAGKGTNIVGILTSGDNSFQKNKVDRYGLRPYIDFVDIVSDGKEERLSYYAKHYNTIMVGNSLRFDILPAYNAGAIPILVESDCWEGDSLPEDVKELSYYSARTLREAGLYIYDLLGDEE